MKFSSLDYPSSFSAPENETTELPVLAPAKITDQNQAKKWPENDAQFQS